MIMKLRWPCWASALAVLLLHQSTQHATATKAAAPSTAILANWTSGSATFFGGPQVIKEPSLVY